MQDILPILVYRKAPGASGPQYLAVFWGKPRGEVIPYAPIADSPDALPAVQGADPLIYQCENAPFPRYRFMSLVRAPHIIVFPGETADAARQAITDWWMSRQQGQAPAEGAREEAVSEGDEEGVQRTTSALGGVSNDGGIWDRIAEAIASRRYASQQEIADAVGTVQTKVSELMIKAEKSGVMPRETAKAIFKEVRASRRATG